MEWYYPTYKFLVSLNDSDKKLLNKIKREKKLNNQTDVIRHLIREAGSKSK